MKYFLFILSVLLLQAFSYSQGFWSSLVTAVPDNLYGVSFANSDTGFVVGGSSEHSLIMKTQNGGDDWEYFYRNQSDQLYDVWMINDSVVLTCGHNGVMLRTTDAGATWNQRPSNVNNWLYDLYFLDTDTGYCVGLGGTILKSTDAGNTWYVKNSGTGLWLLGVYFTSASTGYAVGEEGKIFKTVNFGETWDVLENTDPNFLSSVWFIHPDTGFAVGFEGTILKTTDAGLNWQKVPSGVTFDFQSISFYTHNDGFITGNGTILRTTNAGATWVPTNYPVTTGMQKHCIASENIAYAAGMSGTVLKTDISVGVEEPDISPEFKIYPNPASGYFSISCVPWSGKSVYIRIVSMDGKTVHASLQPLFGGLYTTTCDEWESGMYVVEMYSGSEVIQAKILLED